MPSGFSTIVVLRGEQTAGAISAVENTLPARWEGPPLHRHAFDEAFYILDGELTFQLGDDLFTAGPGALAFAPGGVEHTLANFGDAPARYLLLCTPAGFERYFARLAAQAAAEEPPSWALAPTPPVTTLGAHIGERDDLAAATPIAPAAGRIDVRVRGEQSGGRIAVMENRVGAGFAGPRLHHHDFDELFWVLDGELTFQLGDELLTCRAGELAFAPRGVHHTFANHSGAEARTLIVCTPAGFECHFARMAADHAGVDAPEWALAPVPQVTTVGRQIGREASS
ncbi:MAG TPA: cupin domain-containing protein [Solirubrobacteraceae bacterium]|nr:cupin domain-containing protein [Solirubrobacteraceae bacterium]